jgi:hypothetical protein
VYRLRAPFLFCLRHDQVDGFSVMVKADLPLPIHQLLTINIAKGGLA